MSIFACSAAIPITRRENCRYPRPGFQRDVDQEVTNGASKVQAYSIKLFTISDLTTVWIV